MDGLVPAIVQEADGGRVRMLGYMNQKALEATRESGFVTFFSRSKNRLWVKGETSGNRLHVVSIHDDCDNDAILILAEPEGPTCHKGPDSCFEIETAPHFLATLEAVIAERAEADPDSSYTARLMDKGVKRIAQKVGEEGVEAALAATAGDREELKNEAADLLYHLLVLLKASNLSLRDVTDELKRRHG
ncbi:bifunctional phosphoribosyl-AMP cyclohydrolase/phosphoribosyl-ATP diphosphatase HisIE [Sphingomicrobium sp. GRR-S6-50]|uniref:Histidine biosynthesis bifunctional protein HisIE n=2 Tax=Sphingomicrobium sediminis TaxID=2950949 RepID=A0A9X2EMD1_9SPHN|nr:bifunctional phosphoribosyl-AMP cyclohydrolase/phosphoribosyl-ATP diphosphatase HisIE [Sphingomicrobium sediminis]MCM8558044.1 bifunctional phosphoribosyl-AMP cyclohydrolase/phosphoribosyl-ATP diphosphatase HisIE [Sphingomicrobium sediminis]